VKPSAAVNEEVLARTVALCREKGIILPTFAELRDPGKIPPAILARLAKVGLWDVDPVNLFRITWKNEPKESAGFQRRQLDRVPALTGSTPASKGSSETLPTGAYKSARASAARRACLGELRSTRQKAVWPSTEPLPWGADCARLSCSAIAILPEG
jgi:hypothetical protein